MGETQALELSSSALQDGAVIPAEYCGTSVAGGQNRSPSLDWSGAPDETASFVVVMIDEHRVANQWVHWVIVDLPPQTTSLADNATGSLPAPARELRNAYGDEGYGGPTPPPGSGDHPYVITVYALDTTSTDIKDKPSRSQIERAVEGHVLASGTITGYFGR